MSVLRKTCPNASDPALLGFFEGQQNLQYRHEYKYLLNAKQESILLVKAGGLLTADTHTDDDGGYTVRSLYLDDDRDTCLREKLAGADPRAKYRIRYYGQNTRRLSLEKKQKLHGLCAKENCPLTLEECEQILTGTLPELTPDMPEAKQRLLTEIRQKGLYPKVIVTYRRIPFVYPAGNIRVTFDRLLTSSADTAHFLDGEYIQRPVFAPGRSLLEVKWDELLPSFIKNTLQTEDLQWTAFSKYQACRQLGYYL